MSRRSLSSLVLVVSMCLTTLSCQHSVHPQDPAIEGNWIIDSLDTGYPELQALGSAVGGRIEIAGDTFIQHADRKMSLSFVIGAETYPRRITFYEDGREKGKAIYALDNEKLIICMGESEYPTQLKAVTGKTGLLVLKRP